MKKCKMNALNVIKLMVGNYVLSGKNIAYVRDIHIGNLVEIYDLQLEDYFNCTYTLYGIKLTPEVFEAIGLKKEWCNVLKTDEFSSTDGRVSIITNTINKNWIIVIDNLDMGSIGFSNSKYLHELQNICNLCDYELDIDVEKLKEVVR